jgi:hypothetical protein
MSTAFHPQTDGQTERTNQEIEVYLRIFCANEPDKWSKLLSTLEFAHNSKTHEAIKKPPFLLMQGSEPVALPTVVYRSDAPSAEERLKTLNKAREEALAAHDLARLKMMQHTMRRAKPFKQGEKVWLEAKHLRIPYQSKKLAPKREGPFAIKRVLGPITYELLLPKQWKTHPVFHASLLTPYKETETHGPNHLEPPPDLIDDVEEYEVEALLAHRKLGSRYQYLVKWKGYDSSYNTWEPERNLLNATDVLEAYKRRRKL